MISIEEAKKLAQTEAAETKRVMVLWFFNKPVGKWEALSVHHPSGMKSTLVTVKNKKS